jgi:thiol-disulfide isomerase/thioredoxin
MTRFLAVFAIAVAYIFGTAIAAEPTLKSVKLGEVLYGPPVEAKQLKGAVVFVEQWGIHCGPCIGEIPHMTKLQDELADFGLVIVAAHRQKATPDEVRATARTHGINYTITDGYVSNGASTIPHGYIFDLDGKCVFDGRPGDAENKLRSTLGAALVTQADRSDFNKTISVQVEALKAGKPPAAVLVKLLPLTRAPDAETAAQAKALTDALMAPAKAALASVRDQKADDPLAAYDHTQHMVVAFKGTPVGTDAAKLLNELKSDKKVMAELKTRPLMEKLRAVDQLLAKAMGEKEPKDPAFQKAAAPQLRQLREAAAMLKRTYPDSRAANDAVVLAEKYGLTVK